MLIDNIPDFRAHVDVASDFKWARIDMHLQQAEQEFLLPVLGSDLMALLQEHYDDSGSSDDLDAILLQSQKALAIMGFYLAIPKLQLKQMDTGLYAVTNDEHKSPYQWQVGDYRDSYLQAGYAAIEKLYSVLMEHANSINEWVDSDGYAAYNESLLRNAAEFNQVYKIGLSRITYVDLKPAIDRAQDKYLRPTVGEAFYDSLITYLSEGDDDSASDDVDDALLNKAVKKLRKALAHLAIGEASEVNFRQVNGGLLSSRFDGNRAANEAARTAADITNLRATALRKGGELLSLAHGWLDANAASFPLYINGPGYRAAGTEERTVESRMPNAGGFFMV